MKAGDQAAGLRSDDEAVSTKNSLMAAPVSGYRYSVDWLPRSPRPSTRREPPGRFEVIPGSLSYFAVFSPSPLPVVFTPTAFIRRRGIPSWLRPIDYDSVEFVQGMP